MLTFKRIVIAWILWCGADIVAMVLLTTSHVISVEGRPSSLSGATQFFIWIIVSIALGAGCVRLSWAKIK